MKRALRAVALVVVAMVGASFAADSLAQPTVSPNAQAALVLRVLGYDRALRGRTPSGSVNVLAVYKSGDATSEAACQGLARAISQLGRAVNVSGMRARATPIAYTTPDAFAASARGAQALYVCPGLDASITAISGAARRASILTITSREAHVRSGLSVAIVPGAQLRIVVNVTAAAAEGARLDAALLRIATVVR